MKELKMVLKSILPRYYMPLGVEQGPVPPYRSEQLPSSDNRYGTHCTNLTLFMDNNNN
jgi:hypothetical protein